MQLAVSKILVTLLTYTNYFYLLLDVKFCKEVTHESRSYLANFTFLLCIMEDTTFRFVFLSSF